MKFQFDTVGLVIFPMSFPIDSGGITAAFEVKHVCGDYIIWPYKVAVVFILCYLLKY